MAKTKRKQLIQRTKNVATSKASGETSATIDDSTSVELMKRVSKEKNDADFDTRSTITNKMLRDLHLKKKEKHKLKHSLWKKRVNSALEARLKERSKRKRQQIADIVGDMSSMLESLPIEVLLNKVSSQANCKRERKARGVETESFRQQQKLSGISLFRSVLYHPEFKSNPVQTVTEHLRNKIARENDGGV